MSRGVTREHTALLPRDPSEPMPSQIANDLGVHRREALRDEIKRKMQRAVEAFKNPWLVRTEKELQECTVKLNGSKIDNENRASVQAYREVLQDKLKIFHRNLATLNCEFGLDGRRRWWVSQGLLKKDQRHLVTDLFQCLPIAEDACESIGTEGDGNEAASSHARPKFAAETLLRSYISLIFHARPRNFGGPHADRHYAKKTQVWRTSSSWQQEAAENTSELF